MVAADIQDYHALRDLSARYAIAVDDNDGDAFAAAFQPRRDAAHVPTRRRRLTVRARCIAHHLEPTAHGGVDHVMHIRYADTYRRDADGGWLISARVGRCHWTETRAVDAA